MAPRDCATRTTNSLRDGEPSAFTHPLPLLLLSHCYNCMILRLLLAERLNHGFVVIGVDHSRCHFSNAEGEMLYRTVRRRWISPYSAQYFWRFTDDVNQTIEIAPDIVHSGQLRLGHHRFLRSTDVQD